MLTGEDKKPTCHHRTPPNRSHSSPGGPATQATQHHHPTHHHPSRGNHHQSNHHNPPQRTRSSAQTRRIGARGSGKYRRSVAPQRSRDAGHKHTQTQGARTADYRRKHTGRTGPPMNRQEGRDANTNHAETTTESHHPQRPSTRPARIPHHESNPTRTNPGKPGKQALGR